jgi:pantothenate kinase type III
MTNYDWCIDVGNSSIKWGVFKDSELLEVCQYREDPSSRQIEEFISYYPPRKIGVSAVKGPVSWLNFPNVMKLSANNISPFFVDYSVQENFGIKCIPCTCLQRHFAVFISACFTNTFFAI